MYARITRYRMKPGSVETAKAMLNELKPQIMSLPGIKNFINVMNEDGNGCVVAVVESKEVSDSNQDRVQALWSQFADHLAEPPEMNGYDVLMNESSD